MIEWAYENAGVEQAFETPSSGVAAGESKQRCAADKGEPTAHEERIEAVCSALQACTSALAPSGIRVSGATGCDGIGSDWPIAEERTESLCDTRRGDDEPQAQTGEPVELAKGTEHQKARVSFAAGKGRNAARRRCIGEGFVDDEIAVVLRELIVQRE